MINSFKIINFKRGLIMVNKIRTNLLLVLFMLFSLSCDDESQIITDDDSSKFYCLNMSHVVSGGDSQTDYTSPGEGDHLLTIRLQSSSDELCTEDLDNVEGATLSFDWIINNGDDTPLPPPYLETIPIDGSSSANVYQNGTVQTDASGLVLAYWRDQGHAGCIKILCDYLDVDGNTVISLDTPEEDCASANDDDNNPFEVVTQAAAFEDSDIRSFDLELSPGIIIYNDIEQSDSDANDDASSTTQTNSDLTIEATVLDEGGAGIENVPVNFINETHVDGNYGNYGILTSSLVLTNNLGQATITLVDIDTDNIGNESSIPLQIRAEVYDELGEPVQIELEDNWGDCGDTVNFDCPDGLYDGPTDVVLSLSKVETAT